MGTNAVPGTGGIGTPGLVILCIILLCTSALGFCQDVGVRGSLQPQQVPQNSTALLRFELSYPYAGQVSVMEPRLPDGLSFEAGPFIRPVRSDGKTIIEYTVKGDRPGRYILPPFVIRLPYQNVQTKPLAIFIEDAAADGGSVPLELSWETPEEKLYAGQAFPITVWAELLPKADAETRLFLEHPDDIVLRPIETAAAVYKVTTDMGNLYNLPLESYMLHPSEGGTIRIPGGSVSVDGSSARLPELQFSVLPLPQLLGSKSVNGVGAVEFTAEVRREKSQDIYLVTVEMVFTGEGNLPFFRFPDLKSSSLTYLYSTEQENIRLFTDYPYGYTGSRRRVSSYRQDAGGTAELTTAAVTIFNPETGNYRTFPEQVFSFSPIEPAPVETEQQASINVLPEPAELGRLPIRRMHSKFWAYFLFFPPFAGICIRSFFAGKGKHRNEKNRKGNCIGPAAIVFLLSVCSIALNAEDSGSLLPVGGVPEQGSELYSAAFNAVATERYGTAVFLLRQLHQYRPMDTRIRNAINSVEALAGVEHQIPARLSPHPDLFFWSALGICVVIALIVWLRKKKIKKIVPFVVLLVILSSTGSARISERTSFGVIRKDVALTVVPSETGKKKLVLQEGTTVKIAEHWDTYYQIRTGDDILGWVKSSDLFIQE